MIDFDPWVFGGFGTSNGLFHFTESCLPQSPSVNPLVRTWWFNTESERTAYLDGRHHPDFSVWLKDGDALAIYGPFPNECAALGYMTIADISAKNCKWSVFRSGHNLTSESVECDGYCLFRIEPCLVEPSEWCQAIAA